MRNDAFRARLRAVCTAAGLAPVGPARRAVSFSNDAWSFDDRRHGPVVLRVCWRGDLDRIGREALLHDALPDGVRRPVVLDHGTTTAGGAPVTWSLARRLDGSSMDLRWSAMSAAARDSATAQLTDQLRTLHAWEPPDRVAAALATRTGVDAAERVVDADLLPLPAARLRLLVPYVRRLPWVDAGLVDAAADEAAELADAAPALDDPARHRLVHHDVTLSNVFWSDDGRLTLLDLEWARFGPPDLELLQPCENAEADTLLGDDAHPDLLRRLLVRYPELAAGAGPRLRLYALVYTLRHMVVWRPDGPEDRLDPYHPLRRLRRLLTGAWPTPGAFPASLVP